jgi:hypothetical protein
VTLSAEVRCIYTPHHYPCKSALSYSRFRITYHWSGSRDSSAVQRWAMGWTIRVPNAASDWEFFSSPPIRLHLVPRSRMRGSKPPLPNTPSWRGAQFKRKTQHNFTNDHTYERKEKTFHKELDGSFSKGLPGENRLSTLKGGCSLTSPPHLHCHWCRSKTRYRACNGKEHGSNVSRISGYPI